MVAYSNIPLSELSCGEETNSDGVLNKFGRVPFYPQKAKLSIEQFAEFYLKSPQLAHFKVSTRREIATRDILVNYARYMHTITTRVDTPNAEDAEHLLGLTYDLIYKTYFLQRYTYQFIRSKKSSQEFFETYGDRISRMVFEDICQNICISVDYKS